MNATAPTAAPVVVVTEEKRRRKGLMWVAAGAALLLGGSTFALWSASDVFAGGRITAGDLNLVQMQDTTFWDVSADRADAAHTVTGTDGSQPGHSLDPSDASTWRIVPGDKVAASFTAEVTLDGDNLVGALTIGGAAGSMANEAMTYTYEIYQDGVLRVAESPMGAHPTLMYLSAPGTGQDDGSEDATIAATDPAVDGTTASTSVFAMVNTTEQITMVIYGEFDSTTPDREQVSAADVLPNITLTLSQVRDTGAQFG